MSKSDSSWNEQLKKLYPFLQEDNGLSGTEANLIDSISMKCRESTELKQKFFAENLQEVFETAKDIASVFAKSGRMFSAGNGGSSCDAAHFAVEFQHPVTAGRPALPVINLCNDVAMMSAVANDVGFEHVFVRMLEAQAKPDDGLITFSSSGNSKNLIESLRKSREIGMSTFAITGGDGGLILQSGLAQRCLIVRSDSIHRIQEVHVTLYHILWDIVHTLLSGQRGKS